MFLIAAYIVGCRCYNSRHSIGRLYAIVLTVCVVIGVTILIVLLDDYFASELQVLTRLVSSLDTTSSTRLFLFFILFLWPLAAEWMKTTCFTNIFMRKRKVSNFFLHKDIVSVFP